ncbi:MAG: hypothetical protein EZS28_040649 [Streblomastix strix]|uniref:Uncharacterized protein n=1 Tax=Streblomastix strix TaxID=222440 RepID=A0A5J4U068_9EUKA|nr:MAG: hypothetical protein EZS28_040649 [Streblomastix strix]
MSEVEHPPSSLISIVNCNCTNDELKASQDSTAVTHKPSQLQITENLTLPDIHAPLPSLKIHFASINDEHMNDAGFEIWYDPENRDAYISDEGTPVARVTNQNIMDITSGVLQPYDEGKSVTLRENVLIGGGNFTDTTKISVNIISSTFEYVSFKGNRNGCIGQEEEGSEFCVTTKESALAMYSTSSYVQSQKQMINNAYFEFLTMPTGWATATLVDKVFSMLK